MWVSWGPHQGPFLAIKLPTKELRVPKSSMIGPFRPCRDHHRPKGLTLAWGPFKPKRAHLKPERTNARAEKSTLGYREPSIGPK